MKAAEYKIQDGGDASHVGPRHAGHKKQKDGKDEQEGGFPLQEPFRAHDQEGKYDCRVQESALCAGGGDHPAREGIAESSGDPLVPVQRDLPGEEQEGDAGKVLAEDRDQVVGHVQILLRHGYDQPGQRVGQLAFQQFKIIVTQAQAPGPEPLSVSGEQGGEVFPDAGVGRVGLGDTVEVPVVGPQEGHMKIQEAEVDPQRRDDE